MFCRRLCVVSALICYFVAATSAEPSCVGVDDFGSCNGDTAGFCPSGIGCSCKGEHAFCSCPNYKGPHTDYWYMGAKCDQLWSTWDLVVMAVFPGVALSFVVAVVAQLIHYCKTTAKIKTPKEKKSKSKKTTTESYQNQTFQPEEEPGRNGRYVDVQLSNFPPQSPQNAADWNVAAPQNPLARVHSSYYPKPGQNAEYAEIKRKKTQNYGRPPYGYPDQDYDTEQRPTQQFPRFAAPSIPQADYEQNSSNAGFGNRPFSLRRPQVNYDY